MLRKLLKHEFRATGRIMLPLYLILLATSVAANLSLRYLMNSRAWFLTMVGGLLMMALVIAIIGVCVVSFVLMIQRFYRNLLQDEGYVMLTLPVSIHQHIWSKLIVSSVWFIVTGLAVILACCVTAFDITVIREILWGLGRIFEELRKIQAYYALNGTAIAVELIVLVFLGLVAMCLQFYAALAAGHGFANHKMAWSVAFFFIFQFVMQMAGSVIVIFADATNLDYFLANYVHFGFMAGMHAALIFMIVCVVIYGAIFYGITTFCLKKRLNLE